LVNRWEELMGQQREEQMGQHREEQMPLLVCYTRSPASSTEGRR